MLIRIRRSRSGQAIVIMALAMVAICGMLALAIDAGRLYFQSLIFVLERDLILSHADDASLGMHFDAFVLKSVFNELPNLFSHSGHDSIGHFNNHYARLAAQSTSLHRVAQQRGHLRR